jgi:hypothetical protein
MRTCFLAMVALGLTSLLACSAVETTKGDDGDSVTTTTGDDDDHDITDEGVYFHSCALPVSPNDLVPASLTVWAQFTVEGGVVVPSVLDGANTYKSLVVVNIGPEEWDPSNPNDTNYCSVYAPMGVQELGLLDEGPVVAPYVDVGTTPAVETDCYDYFTLPVGIDPTVLITAYRGWSMGIPPALTPTLEATLGDIDPSYQDQFLGALWYVPIIDPPQWESIYAVAYEVAGGSVGAREILRADLTGQSVLPDGIYYSDALLTLDLTDP